MGQWAQAAGLAVALGLVPAAAPAVAGSAPSTACATPSDKLSQPVPWTHLRLAPERVWPMTRGEGVVVAVIDTGVDRGVPQLAGRVGQGVDVVNGSGVADSDCHGHGTFVAGIIAAQPADGTGMVGLAPGVRILPIRQANGARDGSAASLAVSIVTAVSLGASVVNVSASAQFQSRELESAVAYAADRDVLIVAAVSNEALQGNPVAYPAAYPSVLAVGAVGPDGRRSDFSETGSYVDLVAPGSDVVSLSRGGRGHLVDSGTSFAAPFVSATAALVRSYHPQLTAAQVKRRLELTADQPGALLPDPEVGWGVVNPFRAVTEIIAAEHGSVAAPAARPAVRAPAPDLPASGQRDEAVAFSVGAVVVACVSGLIAYLIPRGIRRRWRSVGEPAPPQSRADGPR